MRVLRAVTLPIAASLVMINGCDGGPTVPTERVEDARPVAGIRTAQLRLPYWHRGPLCCFDDYVVIYFYVANPSDVPADFNLLDVFDLRARAAVFAVEGFNIRANAGDPVPLKLTLQGIAPVPFWFIPSSVFDEVAADAHVGIAELDRPGVLVGFADSFIEELHPSDGTAQQPRLTTAARGALLQGGRFRFTFAAHENPQTGQVNSLINGSLTFE